MFARELRGGAVATPAGRGKKQMRASNIRGWITGLVGFLMMLPFALRVADRFTVYFLNYIVIMAMMCIVLLKISKGCRLPLGSGKIHRCFWLLITIVTLSALINTVFNQDYPAQRMISLGHFYMSAACFLIGFVIFNTRVKVKGLLLGSLISGIVISGLIWYLYYDTGVLAAAAENIHVLGGGWARLRIRTVIPDWPTRYGLILGYFFSISLTFVLYAKTKRFAPLLASMLLLSVCVLTFTRALWLQIVVSSAILLLVRRRRVRLILACSLLVLLLLQLGPAQSIIDAIHARFAEHTIEYGWGARTAMWDAVFDRIAERPILGWGQLGVTELVEGFYDPIAGFRVLGSVHNDYIDMMLRMGILGALIYLTIVIMVIVRGFNLFHCLDDRFMKIYFLGNSVALIGALAFGFFHELFRFQLFAAYFWIYAGITTGLWSRNRTQDVIQQGVPQKPRLLQ